MDEPIDYKKLKLLHEPSEKYEYRNDCFLIGGMGNGMSTFDLAIHYKKSADLLLDSAIDEKDLSYQYSYPIIYLYRHALELGLKSIYPKKYIKHNLDILIKNFDDVIQEDYKEVMPPHFKKWMIDLNKIDPKSTGFRYGSVDCHEYIVVYYDLKNIMNEIFRVLKVINLRPKFT